jgi:hypothetical protein
MRASRLLVPVFGMIFAMAACAAAAPAPPTTAVGGPRSDTTQADSSTPALPAVDTDAAADAGPTESSDANAVSSLDAAAATPPPPQSACNEQSPQDFLVRGNFLKTPGGNQRAIQYRTDTYGFFQGFGRPGPDARPPSASVVETTFMGLPVRMHRKVAPALACVEEEIRRSCTDHPYTAHALAGVRFKNTYRGGEVTNHIYGIAIDVDPSLNTCCGCVKPWNDAPRCHRPAKTEYDRMEMPECWVHAFERYGFYWLGHDVLQDTMHYEFLGDPDHILRSSGPPTARQDAGTDGGS